MNKNHRPKVQSTPDYESPPLRLYAVGSATVFTKQLRCCNCGYGGDCYGGGTDITYLPKVAATIEFRNDRIIAWESSR